jgi:tripartite motif-containing protein 71
LQPPNPNSGPGPRPRVRLPLGLSCAVLAAVVTISIFAREAASKRGAQTLPPLEFLGEWGTKGGEPDNLYQPTGLATDSSGLVYVTDNGNGFIHKFNALGHPLLAFQDPGVPAPGAIAVDSGGAIYVSDSGKKRIFIFWPTGERLREQRRGGGAHFRSIGGLAVDPEGNLYVTDALANQVIKFDANGRLKKAWGKRGTRPGEFHSPGAVAVGPDGSVYVDDMENARIQRFTRDGAWLATWGGAAGEGGLKLPLALAASEKFLFVTDGDTRVHVMNFDGAIVHTEDLSAHVTFNPHFPDLTGIVVVNRSELLVLDSAGAKVLHFRINL